MWSWLTGCYSWYSCDWNYWLSLLEHSCHSQCVLLEYCHSGSGPVSGRFFGSSDGNFSLRDKTGGGGGTELLRESSPDQTKLKTPELDYQEIIKTANYNKCS